ncbi:MAG TPA: hypothetical protein VJ142_00340 [Candidatus Nanoarchaeia archaeon]|nr:hypothetical protein [Candidatus Nanoarchaeia archaeon]
MNYERNRYLKSLRTTLELFYLRLLLAAGGICSGMQTPLHDQACNIKRAAAITVTNQLAGIPKRFGHKLTTRITTPRIVSVHLQLQ